MKRYERMTKEEIIEKYKACCGYCRECPLYEIKTAECKYSGCDCTEAMADYLNEEIKLKTVSRWQTIKSDEDLWKMRQDFHGMCNGTRCDDCSYVGCGKVGCFINYLFEKIEVEDTE